jgi:phytoene synthase
VLERHGGSETDVARGKPSAQLRATLAELRQIARQHLQSARQLFGRAPSAVGPAFLPVALTGPTLALMERRGYDPFVPRDLAPWRKQWLIWRAARRPRRIFDDR